MTNPVDDKAHELGNRDPSGTLHASEFITKRFKDVAAVGKYYHDTGAGYGEPYDMKTPKATARKLIGNAGTKAMHEVYNEGFRQGVAKSKEALRVFGGLHEYILRMDAEPGAPTNKDKMNYRLWPRDSYEWPAAVMAAHIIDATRVMDHIGEDGR